MGRGKVMSQESTGARKYVSYSCTLREYRPVAKHPVRWLDWEADFEAAQSLWPPHAPLTKETWDTAKREGYRYCGAFTESRLVACAAVWTYCEAAWEVAAVFTHPEYRRRGYGQCVVSFITAFILGEGRLATCLTAETNQAMRRAAMSVGFYEAPRPEWANASG